MDTALREIAGMSNDQLNIVIAAINARRSVLARIGVASFRVGQRVAFEARRGERVVGIITRVNRKSVTVEAELSTQERMEGYFPRSWRVSPSFLTAA
jgi:hypothetical protein